MDATQFESMFVATISKVLFFVQKKSKLQLAVWRNCWFSGNKSSLHQWDIDGGVVFWHTDQFIMPIRNRNNSPKVSSSYHLSVECFSQLSFDSEVQMDINKFLTSKIIVIGVENSGNIFSNISVNHGIQIITIIKEFQVEIHRWFSWPQSHGIDTIVIVSRNWVVIGHSQNPLVVNPDFAILVLFVGVIHTSSEKLDLHAVQVNNF